MDKESPLKQLRRKVLAIFHRGTRFTCPVCKHSFGRFLTSGSSSSHLRQVGAIGIGKRPNARCPRCGSNDRARLVIRYLESIQLGSTKPLRVLDIAPDRHIANVIRAREGVEYICGSIDPDDFKDLGAVKVDVTDIPFEDRSFDVVICNHVLQQVPEDRKGMREIARVLKTDGWGLLQVPIASEREITDEDLSPSLSRRDRRTRFGSTQHWRLYGKDYPAILLSEGLTCTITHPQRDGWGTDADQWAINPKESLFVVAAATTE